MNPSTITNTNQAKELLDAHTHVWNIIFAHYNSMSLKCAIELGIQDAIQTQGKPLSVTELANCLNIHPSKVDSFHRLMRFLCHLNLFSLDENDNGESLFGLTLNSKLLLKDHPLSMVPLVVSMLEPTMTNPSSNLSLWLKNDVESPFNVALGRNIWQHAGFMESFNQRFNEAMASDAPFVASLIMNNYESKKVFKDIGSLVDVGGGNGSMAKEIVKINPQVKCIVLDLPHVVEGLGGGEDKIVYIGGNMFEAIPPANVVLLKWILHDWSDENCIKILEKCREAIPKKEQGGKVVIIEMVMEDKSYNHEYFSAQYLCDMQVMTTTIGGKQRNEKEWKKLFIQAGFDNYKITHVLGPRSIIEVYPF